MVKEGSEELSLLADFQFPAATESPTRGKFDEELSYGVGGKVS